MWLGRGVARWGEVRGGCEWAAGASDPARPSRTPCTHGRDSSVGGASDRRSEGPRLDPGLRHNCELVGTSSVLQAKAREGEKNIFGWQQRKATKHNDVLVRLDHQRLFGLVVRFSLRVREVPGSIPGTAPCKFRLTPASEEFVDERRHLERVIGRGFRVHL